MNVPISGSGVDEVGVAAAVNLLLLERLHEALEGFKGRVATYIERIQFRREAPWTRSARTARVSI